MIARVGDLHFLLTAGYGRQAWDNFEGTEAVPITAATDLNFQALFDLNQDAEKRLERWAGKYIQQGCRYLVAMPHVKKGHEQTENISVDNIDIEKSNIVFLNFLYFYLLLKKNTLFNPKLKSGNEISPYKFFQLTLPLPKLHEQKELVSVLKKEVSILETSIKDCEKMLVEIETKNNKTFRRAFGGLNKFVSEGESNAGKTNLVKISEAGLVQAGKTPNSSIEAYFGKKYPFYNQTAFEQGINILHATRYLSDRGIKEARLFPANSVLICFIGAQFGKVGLARIAGACNAQMLSITPHAKLLPEFLYYQMISPDFQQQMKNISTGYAITKSEFEKLYIELPPLSKQVKIVATLSRKIDFDTARMLSQKITKTESKHLESFVGQLSSYMKANQHK